MEESGKIQKDWPTYSPVAAALQECCLRNLKQDLETQMLHIQLRPFGLRRQMFYFSQSLLLGLFQWC